MGRAMKTKVLSIKKIEQFDSAKNHQDGLQVVVLLGDSQKNFTFTVRKAKIGNRELTIFSENENFAKTFQFHDNIGIEITNLVKKVAQGENLNFPIPVSDFSTPEEALTKQKPFESGYNGNSRIVRTN
ncbi:hypothetical protein ACE1CI_26255 [Aerosakkonemataceae cyanobacterium BLCC-F50]|uniref:Uncharacterized protein n=1 Tax=Floridaenema flaviceps BLCC-F50 TaxID=3153642 RepID=A0ABV4XXH2_9CYAN